MVPRPFDNGRSIRMNRFSRLRYVPNMVVYGSMDLALVVDAKMILMVLCSTTTMILVTPHDLFQELNMGSVT